MNVPVVATEHGGVLDIVKEHNSGAFFPVGDYAVLSEKIIALQKKPFFNLRAHVEKEFSLKQMVENTIAVYQGELNR